MIVVVHTAAHLELYLSLPLRVALFSTKFMIHHLELGRSKLKAVIDEPWLCTSELLFKLFPTV